MYSVLFRTVQLYMAAAEIAPMTFQLHNSLSNHNNVTLI